MENPHRQDETTTRRFRVCTDCGEQFYTVRSARHHQHDTGHTGIDHVTAEVRE